MGKVIILHLSVHLFTVGGTYPDLGTCLSWEGYLPWQEGRYLSYPGEYLPWLGSNVKLSTKCQLIKKMSSCQEDVKLSKNCQMSKSQTSGLWRRFTQKIN